jgi:hypothetical protein
MAGLPRFRCHDDGEWQWPCIILDGAQAVLRYFQCNADERGLKLTGAPYSRWEPTHLPHLSWARLVLSAAERLTTTIEGCERAGRFVRR